MPERLGQAVADKTAAVREVETQLKDALEQVPILCVGGKTITPSIELSARRQRRVHFRFAMR